MARIIDKGIQKGGPYDASLESLEPFNQLIQKAATEHFNYMVEEWCENPFLVIRANNFNDMQNLRKKYEIDMIAHGLNEASVRFDLLEELQLDHYFDYPNDDYIVDQKNLKYCIAMFTGLTKECQKALNYINSKN